MAWREKELLKKFALKSVINDSVIVGPGDDCAVLRFRTPNVVITTDLIADGVDFIRGRASYFSIGWKTIMISASDIAAMGCKPMHFVVASSLPKDMETQELDDLWTGLYEASDRCGATVVGGDLSAGSPLTLVSTGLGEPYVKSPILRSTASVGDGIYVTGALGGSILGRHLNFVARTDFAQVLAKKNLATAMIDISDGLSGDLVNLANASKVDFIVDSNLIPIHNDSVQLSKKTQHPPIFHALNDGEDFELIFTVSPHKEEMAGKVLADAGLEAVRIGEILALDSGRKLKIQDKEVPWNIQSYEHC